MTNVTDEILGKFARQQSDLFRRIREGSVDYDYAARGLQDIMEGKFVPVVNQTPPLAYPARDFSRYDSYLLSLDDQLQRLKGLNKKLPKKLQVAARSLDLDTDTDHIQSVEDMEIFFIVLDTLEKTLAVNWEIIKLTQPAVSRSDFETDVANLRLGPNTRWYEPGIHRVRINLVDNWSPDGGRNIEQVRNRVAGTNTLLASVEPIGAYGLHDELFQQQDGENLPYVDLAGLQQGRGFGGVPSFGWDPIHRKAYLISWGSGTVDQECAAPSLGEC